MRARFSPLFVASIVVLGGACSLAVQSELDDKPPGGGATPSLDAGPEASDVDADAQPDVHLEDSSPDSADSSPDAEADAMDAEADATDDGADAADASEAEAGACAGCSAEQCCGGVCVDTTTSSDNCGVCGHVCSAGRSCTAGACASGWITSATAPSDQERAGACGVWAGDRVFIWGGAMLPGKQPRGDGLTYDPKTDDWTPIPATASSPSPRSEPVCIWTGTSVFVWGGVDPATQAMLADGAAWDPATGEWTALPGGGPTGRSRPVALWAGTTAWVWGGTDLSTNHGVKSGAMWNDAGWKPISTTGAPAKNKELAAAWTGTDALVFGGRDDGGGNVYNTIFAYTPASDAWAAITPTSGTALAVRSSAFVAFANDRLLAWGGYDKFFVALGDGARVKLAAPISWESVAATDAPASRAAVPFVSGWIAVQGTLAHVMGGVTGVDAVASDGGTYDVNLDVWTPIPPWGTESHRYGVGVWTGEEFFVWGGYDGSTPLVDASRWMP